MLCEVCFKNRSEKDGICSVCRFEGDQKEKRMNLSKLSLGELKSEAYDQALYLKSDYDAPVCDFRKVADAAANLADLVIEIGKREGKE